MRPHRRLLLLVGALNAVVLVVTAGGQIYDTNFYSLWEATALRAGDQQESLELLQRQSVPFAYSTHDPVFDDMMHYPRIHEYLLQHHVELEGSDGRVLVDTRRTPTGEFAMLGFPCFR